MLPSVGNQPAYGIQLVIAGKDQRLLARLVALVVQHVHLLNEVIEDFQQAIALPDSLPQVRGLETRFSRRIVGPVRTEQVGELERLANATNRSRSWHIEQALESYLDVQSWQIGQIEKSMAEIDTGKGIPHEEIKKELGNWGIGGRAKRAKRPLLGRLRLGLT